MTKRIALFFDGTWEKGAAGKPGTNVQKLYKATTGLNTKSGECGQSTQPTHYISGVGSDWWNSLSGGIGGRGLSDKIQEGYKFLVKNYDREKKDEIFVFGFSRGAYAARSLVGFVDEVGILLEKHMRLVPLAFEIYKETDENKKNKKIKLLTDEMSRDSNNDVLNPFLTTLNGEQVLPIYFIGVWDTVGSLGIPFPGLHYLTAKWVKFHNTELPKNVTHARHALALHELRPLFEPTLWTKLTNPSQSTDKLKNPSLKQCWFPGAHADVGGGYEEDGLSHNALLWMAREAQMAGLMFVPSYISEISKISIQNNVHTEIRPWKLGMFSFPRSRSSLSQMYRPIHRKPSEWESEDERNAFWDTICFHESTGKWLLDANPYKYPYPWRNVSNVLADVDIQSVKLFLGLHYREMGDDAWWRHITKFDVKNCRQQVKEFFADPLGTGHLLYSLSISKAVVLLYLFDLAGLCSIIVENTRFSAGDPLLISDNVDCVWKDVRELLPEKDNGDEYFKSCIEMFILNARIDCAEEVQIGL